MPAEHHLPLTLLVPVWNHNSHNLSQSKLPHQQYLLCLQLLRWISLFLR